MPQKKPKLYLKRQEDVPKLRKERKEALSSTGRNRRKSPARLYGPIPLNRSQNWKYFTSYSEARIHALDFGHKCQYDTVK